MSLKRLDHYEILERLGDRFLYKARDTKNGSVVAIKILPAWMRTQERLARFKREIEVERAIDHPNIARFHDVGEAKVNDPELVGSASDESGEAVVLYFVREFVQGESLARILESRRLPLALAVSIAIQIAEGLGALHSRGIVHRNLHPESIHVTRSGEVKLLDFGMVKILRDEMAEGEQFKTAAGQLLGTAPYLAPEQIQGDAITAQTDLFAVGVILYEMVAGQRPYASDDLLTYFHAIEKEEPRPLSDYVDNPSPELEKILYRLLAKDPRQRFQSAGEVTSELSAFLKSPTV